MLCGQLWAVSAEEQAHMLVQKSKILSSSTNKLLSSPKVESQVSNNIDVMETISEMLNYILTSIHRITRANRMDLVSSKPKGFTVLRKIGYLLHVD